MFVRDVCVGRARDVLSLGFEWVCFGVGGSWLMVWTRVWTWCSTWWGFGGGVGVERRVEVKRRSDGKGSQERKTKKFIFPIRFAQLALIIFCLSFLDKGLMSDDMINYIWCIRRWVLTLGNPSRLICEVKSK